MVKQPQVRHAGPVRVRVAILVAGIVATLAACSSGTTSSSSSGTAAPRTTSPATHSGSPTANQSTCRHVSSLRASLESLTHLQLIASSAGKIRTDLTNIQTQLGELKSQGSGALSGQVNQLSTSVNQVKKAANGLSSPPSASQITAVVSALSGLRAQSKATVAKMKAACPQ